MHYSSRDCKTKQCLYTFWALLRFKSLMIKFLQKKLRKLQIESGVSHWKRDEPEPYPLGERNLPE